MKNTAIAFVATLLVASAMVGTLAARAQAVEAPVATPTAVLSTLKLPDSTARLQFKNLSSAALKKNEAASKLEARSGPLKLPLDPNAPTRPAAENIQRLEEMRVYGSGDPEDYVAPKPPPMLVFRATLDKQRPMTAKEITQLGLCFVGLCGIYKPDGSPYELSAVDRAEERKNATTMELARVRGTLQ